MSKLITFTEIGRNGISKELPPTIPISPSIATTPPLRSAIVLSGSWTLNDDVTQQGNAIGPQEEGGPDYDGAYKDFVDWNGAVSFCVKFTSHG